MKSVIVLQARTNSSRLPGKVLLPINGIPLVVLAAKRAANTGREIIVATSRVGSDDYLASVVESNGLICSRGSLENTLERVVMALSKYDDGTIVFRLTGDNVFPDGALLDEIEKDFLSRNLEYLCCNGEPSGLPYGMSVEITRLCHLRDANKNTSSLQDREHVTPFIIRKFGAQFFEKYHDFGKGHFRCTVDCLDDYLNVCKVFSEISDSIFVSSFDLMEKLEGLPHQPIEKAPIGKLVFGTAQLGMQYGISNTTGKPNLEKSEALIKFAITNGVCYLDTARGYGNSEEVIGQSLKDGWEGRVSTITKLSPLTEVPSDASLSTVKAYVDASVYRSCSMLRMQKLDVLMLHRASHLHEFNCGVWQRLLELREVGIIKELGVSVQSPEELESVLPVSDITFIQLPFNVFDWRWDAIIPKIKSEKARRNLTVHVRSALLQGLLPSTEPYLWNKANEETPHEKIQWLQKQVQFYHRHNVTDLCFSYVNALDWVDGIVVGMENMDQFTENIKLFCLRPLGEHELLNICENRPYLSEATLNPSFWKNP